MRARHPTSLRCCAPSGFAQPPIAVTCSISIVEEHEVRSAAGQQGTSRPGLTDSPGCSYLLRACLRTMTGRRAVSCLPSRLHWSTVSHAAALTRKRATRAKAVTCAFVNRDPRVLVSDFSRQIMMSKCSLHASRQPAFARIVLWRCARLGRGVVKVANRGQLRAPLTAATGRRSLLVASYLQTMYPWLETALTNSAAHPAWWGIGRMQAMRDLACAVTTLAGCT